MRAAGVDCAVLAPPTWDPSGNAPSLEAATTRPDLFAVTGDLDITTPPDPHLIERWSRQPGMNGLRLIFNTPEKQRRLVDGSVEWIWQAAERVDIPVMLLIPGGVHLLADIANRFSGLRLCIDHLGIPRGTQDQAAFEHLPDLLALAKFSNVVVKAGGTPAYSSIDAHPHPSLHGHLRRVYDAFGPERIFWASDLTRMACTYRDVVTLWTEGLPWLSQQDKRSIMGGAVCRWLNWAPERHRQLDSAAMRG
jgi:predicted TIM-barrel fold metal-dependent hydrolase